MPLLPPSFRELTVGCALYIFTAFPPFRFSGVVGLLQRRLIFSNILSRQHASTLR